MGNASKSREDSAENLEADKNQGDVLNRNITANKHKLKYEIPPGTKASRARAVQSPEMMQWLKRYEVTGGPRPDQFVAHVWFASKGWEEKWPLQHAAMSGDIKKIRFLILKKKIDPNIRMKDWFQSQPLGWAASCGQLKAIIELIKLGADPLLPPNDAGNTPLMDAAHEKHQHVVTFLTAYEKKLRSYMNKNRDLDKEKTCTMTVLLCG